MKTLTYTTIEKVSYRRTVEVPDDLNLDDAEAVERLLEADWTEAGDPISDFAAVEDRYFHLGGVTMRMPPYVFIKPDGSVLTVHCFPVDAGELALQIGAITYGPAEDREVLLEAVYGSLGCQVCVIEAHYDRPPNRLPREG